MQSKNDNKTKIMFDKILESAYNLETFFGIIVKCTLKMKLIN